jgi:hypothetical protein
MLEKIFDNDAPVRIGGSARGSGAPGRDVFSLG